MWDLPRHHPTALASLEFRPHPTLHTASVGRSSQIQLEQGQKSHVEISTTMNTSPGFRGLIERIIVSIANPRIYRKELKLLEEVAQRRGTPVVE